MSTVNNTAAAAARMQIPAEELARISKESGISVEALERLHAADREFWTRYARGEGQQIRNLGSITAQTSDVRADALRKLCALYVVPESLTREIVNAQWPVATVAQMLAVATGEARAIGPAGIGYCRLRLGQAKMGSAS